MKNNIVYMEYDITHNNIWESEHMPSSMPLDVYLKYCLWRYTYTTYYEDVSYKYATREFK